MAVYQKPWMSLWAIVLPGRLADPDRHATGEQVAAVGDRAVGDLVAGRSAGRLARGSAASPIFTPPAPRSVSCAAADAVVLAALAQFDPVGSDVRDRAVLEACRTARPGPRWPRARRWPPGRSRSWLGSGFRLHSVGRLPRRLAGRRTRGRSTTRRGRSSRPRNVTCWTNWPASGLPTSRRTCASRGATTCAALGSRPAGGIR